MKHPSIRRRLMVGTGVFVALVLATSLVVIYQSISRMLYKEVRVQLIESASILSKSSELEPTGVVYEWNEALESDVKASVSGLFQFWDLNSGSTVGSPALKGQSLEMFHADLNQSILKPITLPDGRPAMAVGLKHLPFLDAAGAAEIDAAGSAVRPADFPQVLVCARETASIDEKLARMKFHLAQAGAATVFAIWLSIYLITRSTMRPISQLAERLEKRSKQESGIVSEIPDDLPVELRGLAGAFNRTLNRVEAARDRERDFALHAAHELRTPLAGVQATLEQALHRERTAEELRERIGMALTVTEGMRGVIASLMKIARARGRIDEPDRKPFDPGVLVRSLVDAERTRMDTCGHSMTLALGSEVELVSDRELVALVVSMMLDNVIHHAPPNSEIKVGIESGGRSVDIFTENPCVDLEESDLKRLMEPFQRGEHSRMEGAGLGLSLGREIAELLDGRLRIKLVGKRLRVEFSLPVK